MWNKKGGLMLVETMTTKEMIDELRKDFSQIQEKTWKFIDGGGIRHLRRPNAKFPAYITRDIQTSRGNKYISIILFRKRGDVFKLNASELVSAILQTKEGLATVSLSYSGKYRKEILHYYRPHMFKRYKERMGLDLDGIDLIKYFDNRNADLIVQDDYKHKEGDMEHDIMLTCYDGALFGTIKEDGGDICYMLNTFIANETMQDGYKSKFNRRHNEAIDKAEFFSKLGSGYSSDYHKRK